LGGNGKVVSKTTNLRGAKKDFLAKNKIPDPEDFKHNIIPESKAHESKTHEELHGSEQDTRGKNDQIGASTTTNTNTNQIIPPHFGPNGELIMPHPTAQHQEYLGQQATDIQHPDNIQHQTDINLGKTTHQTDHNSYQTVHHPGKYPGSSKYNDLLGKRAGDEESPQNPNEQIPKVAHDDHAENIYSGYNHDYDYDNFESHDPNNSFEEGRPLSDSENFGIDRFYDKGDGHHFIEEGAVTPTPTLKHKVR
jgi:hypothetical protein